ncbi:M48 family metallopeptidase [Sphingomonas sp. DG1-23]|uniref:M48 family metallopeptidase n=1 Tax=Sphingomonas sp. DG1-23 TaxID=3068316 RepID=UPI0027401336|nr:M48 family metallopeptidase [Sphingomonas sp. DG1-23]MDP5280665.1 M48 family metallopeptidase [Sphingomonas sp. DG1-23]
MLPGAARAAASESDQVAVFEAVRDADLKLAAIGWRLAVANAPLCDRLEPGTGLQLHTLDQFDSGTRDLARTHFGFATPVAIEAVVPGSPAQRAGLRNDDSLVRVGPIDIAALPGTAGTTQRLVAAQLALAKLAPDAPIEVEATRAGAPIRVTIQPVPACKSRFELRLASDFNASADGTMVQISARFFETYPEEQVVAAIAHEFAHNVLHHRDRLEARGVDFGLLSGFGGNVKYFRQTELQADLLSVYLLINAGYPPEASTAFWRSFGPSKAGGIFRSRSHPHWRDRVATLDAEIARARTISTRPIVPAQIAERAQPLSGDWQSLLVRHR